MVDCDNTWTSGRSFGQKQVSVHIRMHYVESPGLSFNSGEHARHLPPVNEGWCQRQVRHIYRLDLYRFRKTRVSSRRWWRCEEHDLVTCPRDSVEQMPGVSLDASTLKCFKTQKRDSQFSHRFVSWIGSSLVPLAQSNINRPWRRDGEGISAIDHNGPRFHCGPKCGRRHLPKD